MGFLAEVQAFCWTGGGDCLCGLSVWNYGAKRESYPSNGQEHGNGEEGKRRRMIPGSATTMEVDLGVDPRSKGSAGWKEDGQA